MDTYSPGSGVTLTVVVTDNKLSRQQIVNTPKLTQSRPVDVVYENNSAWVTTRPSISCSPDIFKDDAPGGDNR